MKEIIERNSPRGPVTAANLLDPEFHKFCNEKSRVLAGKLRFSDSAFAKRTPASKAVERNNE